MTWRTALIYSLREHLPVYDKDGEPHWVDLHHTGDHCLMAPKLCSESFKEAFAVSLEPYTKERKEEHR
jgi:hypothetical protein